MCIGSPSDEAAPRTNDDEAAILVLLVQLLEALVLRREAALGRDCGGERACFQGSVRGRGEIMASLATARPPPSTRPPMPLAHHSL